MTRLTSPVQLTVPADCSCFESQFEAEAGHRYLFSVSGEWVDLNDPPVNANGYAHPGGIREHMGWAKRLPDAPWMALLVRSKGEHTKSKWQWLQDGDNIVTGLPAGDLQLCANDMPGFYWNNSLQLNVTVTDITAQT